MPGPFVCRCLIGPEFVAKELRKWLARTGAATLYIKPGSTWENRNCESFNSKRRDEFLNGEIFYSLKEAQVLAERWRIYWNSARLHSSPGYRPPAPKAWQSEASLARRFKYQPRRASPALSLVQNAGQTRRAVPNARPVQQSDLDCAGNLARSFWVAHEPVSRTVNVGVVARDGSVGIVTDGNRAVVIACLQVCARSIKFRESSIFFADPPAYDMLLINYVAGNCTWTL